MTGRTRLGEEVTGLIDWDEDGEFTPFDAHLFALVEGRNADLPRSTSEVYLERWQPWYMRWAGTDRIPDNLYGRAARKIAEDNGLPRDEAGLARELDVRYNALDESMSKLSVSEDEAWFDISRLQDHLRSRVGERWPALSHPYTGAYQNVVDDHVADIATFIVAHEQYDQPQVTFTPRCCTVIANKPNDRTD